MPDKPIDPENAFVAIGKMAETFVQAYTEAAGRAVREIGEAFAAAARGIAASRAKTRDDYTLTDDQ